jgi:hypothetical protein
LKSAFERQKANSKKQKAIWTSQQQSKTGAWGFAFFFLPLSSLKKQTANSTRQHGPVSRNQKQVIWFFLFAFCFFLLSSHRENL